MNLKKETTLEISEIRQERTSKQYVHNIHNFKFDIFPRRFNLDLYLFSDLSVFTELIKEENVSTTEFNSEAVISDA